MSKQEINNGYISVLERVPKNPCDCQLITRSLDGELIENAAYFDGDTFYVMSFMFDPPEIATPSMYNCEPYAWKPIDPLPSKKVGE